MKSFMNYIGIVALAAGAAAVTANDACSKLILSEPNNTFFNLESQYHTIEENYWSSSCELGPQCIYEPTTPEQMGNAIKTLVSMQVPFALKGGGHMPTPGFNNINSSGVLLSSSGFKQLEISADGKTVHVGPGNIWDDVYQYLEPYGCTVVGGRLGIVGIPNTDSENLQWIPHRRRCSYFGNEYGWAGANIASMTAVLANGNVVKATPSNQYSDLFWALRGGGNSFAIVTDFELDTILAPKVMIGSLTYSDSVTSEQFLDAIYYYAINGFQDAKAANVPLVQYNSLTKQTSFTNFLFYNGGGPGQIPDAIANFTDPIMPTSANTLSYRSMGNWSTELLKGTEPARGTRNRFWVLNFFADREALQIVYDTYMDALTKLDTGFGVLVSGLALMPVPILFFEASKANGGDPQSVDTSSGTQIFVEESITCIGSLSDADVDKFYADTNAKITSLLEAKNKKISKFLYMNDANALQPVFDGYPASSIKKPKKIRAKYDPDRVYTNLMPGGWKVDP